MKAIMGEGCEVTLLTLPTLIPCALPSRGIPPQACLRLSLADVYGFGWNWTVLCMSAPFMSCCLILGHRAQRWQKKESAHRCRVYHSGGRTLFPASMARMSRALFLFSAERSGEGGVTVQDSSCAFFLACSFSHRS